MKYLPVAIFSWWDKDNYRWVWRAASKIGRVKSCRSKKEIQHLISCGYPVICYGADKNTLTGEWVPSDPAWNNVL